MIQLTQLKKNLESDKKDDYIHQIKFSEFWVRFYDFEKFQIANKHLKIYPDLKKVTLDKLFKQIPCSIFLKANLAFWMRNISIQYSFYLKNIDIFYEKDD